MTNPEITWDKTFVPAPDKVDRSIGTHSIYFDHAMVINFKYPSGGRSSSQDHISHGGFVCTCGEGGWYDYEMGRAEALEHLLDVAEELLK